MGRGRKATIHPPRGIPGRVTQPSSEAYVYALVLGRVVGALRERRGMSQAQLAAAVGLTQSTLSRIERGQAQPDAFTFRKLAGAFEVSAGELSDWIDQAYARSAEAAKGAIGGRRAQKNWWQAAVAVAGFAGLGGLVAFAVAAALDDLAKTKPPDRKPR